MNRAFNRQRGLRATVILVAAGAATVAGAGGTALAAIHSSSQAAAPCVSKASAPVRVGAISGISAAQPASAACNFAGNTAIGSPPLIWHGGAVMGTAETGPIVITPIFWTPADHPMAADYQSLITQYINDVAAASGSATNVFSILPEYFGSDGSIRYAIQAGTPIIDTNPLPADGCKLNSKDTKAIYADGTGYDACLIDAQVQAETNSVVAANKLPVNLSHIYVMYLPKHVEACIFPGPTTNVKNACTINYQPSAAFCAYDSQAPNGLGTRTCRYRSTCRAPASPAAATPAGPGSAASSRRTTTQMATP